MVDSIPEEGLDLIKAATEANERSMQRKPLVGQAAAFLADPDLWKNYENEMLAEIEEALRSWMEEMSRLPSWRTTNASAVRRALS